YWNRNRASLERNLIDRLIHRNGPLSPGLQYAAAMDAKLAAVTPFHLLRDRRDRSVNQLVKCTGWDRTITMPSWQDSTEGFDGLEAQCAGLRVLVLSDVEALQSGRDSIGDSITNIRLLKVLKVAGVGQVPGHDVDLRCLQPLQRRPGASM